MCFQFSWMRATTATDKNTLGLWTSSSKNVKGIFYMTRLLKMHIFDSGSAKKPLLHLNKIIQHFHKLMQCALTVLTQARTHTRTHNVCKHHAVRWRGKSSFAQLEYGIRDATSAKWGPQPSHLKLDVNPFFLFFPFPPAAHSNERELKRGKKWQAVSSGWLCAQRTEQVELLMLTIWQTDPRWCYQQIQEDVPLTLVFCVKLVHDVQAKVWYSHFQHCCCVGYNLSNVVVAFSKW